MAKKERAPRHTTPKGIAVYPRLQKADTKFEKAGVYTVKLKLPAEEAQPLIEQIEEAWEANTAKAAAELKKKGKKPKDSDRPYRSELNEEGDETGFVLFNFKMKASGKKEDGTTWTMKPKLFDAKGQPFPSSKNISGGSEIKVSYALHSWCNPKGEVGVSLRLEAVQVIKLVEYNGGSASDYGFGEEEGDSFDAEDETDSTSEDNGSEDSVGEGEETDF